MQIGPKGGELVDQALRFALPPDRPQNVHLAPTPVNVVRAAATTDVPQRHVSVEVLVADIQRVQFVVVGIVLIQRIRLQAVALNRAIDRHVQPAELGDDVLEAGKVDVCVKVHFDTEIVEDGILQKLRTFAGAILIADHHDGI